LAARFGKPGARAQSIIPVVGFLNSLSPVETNHIVDASRQGVALAGLVEGESVRFEYLYAAGVHQRLPDMAAKCVHRNVGVIAAGAPPAAPAALFGNSEDVRSLHLSKVFKTF
jgi:putative ABC transport system substrate-binding protein